MKQFTRQQAIAFAEAGTWKAMTDVEAARFQLQQDCLCMPMAVFKRVLSSALRRPVYTHELVEPEVLLAELDAAHPAIS